MSMNVTVTPQSDPNQATANQTGPANTSRAPLSPIEQSELAESMARDKYRARERERDDQFSKHFLESHDAILKGNSDESPAGVAAGTAVATAATQAGSPRVPPALQNVVADRAPGTQAFGQLGDLVSNSMNGGGTPGARFGGSPLNGQQAYGLAHETVNQMGILTPAQMAPFNAAAKKTLQNPQASINQSFPLSGAGAAGLGAATAGTLATPGVLATASASKQAVSQPSAGAEGAPAGAATNPSVGAPDAAPGSAPPTDSALNLIYNGSIQSVMMMVLSQSSKESALEKKDAIQDLAKYSKISALLGDVLTNKIGPAQEELNKKVSSAKAKDSAQQTVLIKDYPKNIDLTRLDPNNPDQLLAGTHDQPIKANQSEMTQLNAELTQQQTTLQNSQTMATNKINARDSQVNNTMGQMSQILKVFNDTASQIGRNI